MLSTTSLSCHIIQEADVLLLFWWEMGLEQKQRPGVQVNELMTSLASPVLSSRSLLDSGKRLT